MKTLALAIVICIPFALIASAGEDAAVNAYTEHHDANDGANYAPECLVTALGSKLCDSDARAWCEDIDHDDIAGRGTGNERLVKTIDDPDTRDACESVGWTS